MAPARTKTISASQIHCVGHVVDLPATAVESWTVAVAVAEVNPLTRVVVARQEPSGRALGAAKVTFHDCPGARVMVRCEGKGPELVPPGPSLRRTVPLRSTARPPVLFTCATTTGCPAAVMCPVTE